MILESALWLLGQTIRFVVAGHGCH